ncbi:MAG: alpha/beta hydrolase [Ruminococcaceae bacterium]|nr:alpha/beta hydrolase [Oscillospiraceae bacterium]
MFDIVIRIILFAAAAVVCFCMVVEVLKVRVKRESAISDAGGIDEMVSVRVNSCTHSMQIRGRDRTRPVLLMLHGGPGNPLMPISHVFGRGLEAHFIVCHYDQRCAGKSYEPGMESGIVPTLDLMADDCLHIVMYLKERFGREKILLAGHSWGTVLGTTLVRRYPKHFLGYIGIGQLVDFVENERICYDTVLRDVKMRRERRSEEELCRIAPYPDGDRIEPDKCMILRRHSTVYNFRKTTAGLAGAFRYVRSVLRSPAYSLRDTTVYAHNIFDTYRRIISRDLAEYSVYRYPLRYDVPMYFISGEGDTMTPISLSRRFYEQLDCPDKQFFTVAGAGHSPMLDRPGLFADIVANRIYPRIMLHERMKKT